MKKPTNSGAYKEENAVLASGIAIPHSEENKTEEQKPILKVEPENPVAPAHEPVKGRTLMEMILKVENFQLIIEKRAKLVQTRSERERFQTISNDFNCSMRLNNSDGNVFTTSLTLGVMKVIDFLRSSFDASIADVEGKIKF